MAPVKGPHTELPGLPRGWAGTEGGTLRKGGHSSSLAWLRLSLCSQSVWKMLAVPSLYSGRRDTPEASQKRTVPSSCLGRGEGETCRSVQRSWESCLSLARGPDSPHTTS